MLHWGRYRSCVCSSDRSRSSCRSCCWWGRDPACGQGWCDLPRKQVERKIPRRDAAYNAKGPPKGVVNDMFVGLVRVGMGVEDLGGEERHVVDRTRNVDAFRQPKGLALVICLGQCQVVQVQLDPSADLHQDL